ncbi:Kelch-like protein 10, partial [Stegodyphus mimosarum]
MFFGVAWLVERFSFLTECFRFIQTHFESVVRSHDSNFADLPLSFVKSFLNLSGITEDVIWMAAVTWLKKDPAERLQVLPELLACLCFQNLDEHLATEILGNPLVKEHLLNSIPQNSICRKTYVGNLFKQFANNSKNNDNSEKLKSLILRSKTVYGTYPLPSKSRLPKCLFLFSGSATHVSFDKKFYITFDEELDVWQEINGNPIWPQALVSVGSRVYIFDESENKILALNLEDKTWTHVKPMNTQRHEYSVVAMGLNIYVLGGTLFNSQVHTSLVEKYDCVTGCWEEVRSMPTSCTFAVGAENVICAVGASRNPEDFQMIAQVYNPDKDTWALINGPNIYRENFALVSLRDKIYILGGSNNGKYLRSVEEYDTEEDTWKLFVDLPFPYYSPKAIIYKDTILVCTAKRAYQQQGSGPARMKNTKQRKVLLQQKPAPMGNQKRLFEDKQRKRRTTEPKTTMSREITGICQPRSMKRKQPDDARSIPLQEPRKTKRVFRFRGKVRELQSKEEARIPESSADKKNRPIQRPRNEKKRGFGSEYQPPEMIENPKLEIPNMARILRQENAGV